MNQKKWIICMMAVIVIGLIAAPITAQRFSRGKARLNGDVVDEEGNPVAGVKVELVFEDEITKFTTETDEKGNWAVIGLGTGQFRITATMEGYIPSFQMVTVSQLNRNPKVHHTLKVAVQAMMHESFLGFLEAGNKNFKDRKFAEAIAEYQKILDKHPEMHTILFKVGDCYREMGEMEKANEIYNTVIGIAIEKKDNSVHAQALGNLGAISVQNQDFDKANEYFQRAIALDPKDEILAYNVAEINFNGNHVDLAIKYYKMASEIKPEWSVPYQKLGYSYLNKGDFASAVASFKKFLELEPEGEQAAIIRELITSLDQS